MIRLFQFIIISALLLVSTSLEAQNIRAKVTDNFAKKYPGTEVLEWEYFDKSYTASFFQGDNYIVSIFDENGNWQQSTRQLKEEQLPRKVKRCWKKKFKDVQFVSAMLEVDKMTEKPKYHISFESSQDLVNLVYNRRGRLKEKVKEPIVQD